MTQTKGDPVYALELTLKFKEDSDDLGKATAFATLSMIEWWSSLRVLLGKSALEIDEIALVDDDFHRAYGENRFIDLSELKGTTDGGRNDPNQTEAGEEGDQSESA